MSRWNWKTITGGVVWICHAVRVVLEILGGIDFIVEKSQNLGWFGKVVELLLKPPPGAILITLLMGGGLIYWGLKRQSIPVPLSAENTQPNTTSPPNTPPPNVRTAPVQFESKPSKYGVWHQTRTITDDDELGEWQMVGMMPKRDIWVLDAIHYVAFKTWDYVVSDADYVGKRLQAKNIAIEEIRQKARDGLLPVWGREDHFDTFEILPPEYWRLYGISLVSALLGEGRQVETEKRRSFSSASIGVVQALMTNKAAVEKLWPIT